LWKKRSLCRLGDNTLSTSAPTVREVEGNDRFKFDAGDIARDVLKAGGLHCYSVVLLSASHRHRVTESDTGKQQALLKCS
jgi:hypothetical protein